MKQFYQTPQSLVITILENDVIASSDEWINDGNSGYSDWENL